MATYLITQASGGQSKWVIIHLVAAGAKVHAVVRNPSTLAPELQLPGVTVFKGESNDFDAVYAAAKGCTGAFLNTFPIPGLEAQQAKTIVEAAKKAGIETMVSSSTACTDNKSLWDNAETEACGLRTYYQSKFDNEALVREAGFKSYTILRPGFIHFDYYLPNSAHNFPGLENGLLAHAYSEGARMPQTDASDVGKYAAAALLDPAKFNGAEIEIISSSPTIEEVHALLEKVSGRKLKLHKRTQEEVEEAMKTTFGQTFHLFASIKDMASSHKPAIEKAKKYGIPFTPLEQSLEREKARLLSTIPAN
ncbi:hypothetical protein G7046_g216 [Stylonectria norvegica]|nr:hypothetical protein G7046_g216 [Stylonectria norvegica]